MLGAAVLGTRVLSHIPGFSPLDAIAFLLPSYHEQRCPQASPKSPGRRGGGGRGAKTAPVENQCSGTVLG